MDKFQTHVVFHSAETIPLNLFKDSPLHKLNARLFRPVEFSELGKLVESSNELRTLFGRNLFFSRRTTIYQNLLHYRLWQQLAQDSTNDFYLVLDQDHALDPAVHDFVTRNACSLAEKELTLLSFASEVPTAVDSTLVSIVPLNVKHYLGGPLFYAINKQGAQKAIEQVQKHSFLLPLDHFLPTFCNLQTFATTKMMATNPRNAHYFNIPLQDPSDTLPLGIPDSFWTEELDKNFVYIDKLDQYAHDLLYFNHPRHNQMYRALTLGSCHGFNTFGYFKDNLELFSRPPAFDNGHGTFVKRTSLQKIIDNTLLLHESSHFKRRDAILRLYPPASQKAKIVVVNLERRPDRKLTMTMELENANFYHYSFFPAVDGNAL